jgi:hypothetical protein
MGELVRAEERAVLAEARERQAKDARLSQLKAFEALELAKKQALATCEALSASAAEQKSLLESERQQRSLTQAHAASELEQARSELAACLVQLVDARAELADSKSALTTAEDALRQRATRLEAASDADIALRASVALCVRQQAVRALIRTQVLRRQLHAWHLWQRAVGLTVPYVARLERAVAFYQIQPATRQLRGVARRVWPHEFFTAWTAWHDALAPPVFVFPHHSSTDPHISPDGVSEPNLAQPSAVGLRLVSSAHFTTLASETAPPAATMLAELPGTLSENRPKLPFPFPLKFPLAPAAYEVDPLSEAASARRELEEQVLVAVAARATLETQLTQAREELRVLSVERAQAVARAAGSDDAQRRCEVMQSEGELLVVAKAELEVALSTTQARLHGLAAQLEAANADRTDLELKQRERDQLIERLQNELKSMQAHATSLSELLHTRCMDLSSAKDQLRRVGGQLERAERGREEADARLREEVQAAEYRSASLTSAAAHATNQLEPADSSEAVRAQFGLLQGELRVMQQRLAVATARLSQRQDELSRCKQEMDDRLAKADDALAAVQLQLDQQTLRTTLAALQATSLTRGSASARVGEAAAIEQQLQAVRRELHSAEAELRELRELRVELRLRYACLASPLSLHFSPLCFSVTAAALALSGVRRLGKAWKRPRDCNFTTANSPGRQARLRLTCVCSEMPLSFPAGKRRPQSRPQSAFTASRLAHNGRRMSPRYALC